ncbi:MAG: pyridoxal-phosphate dependent enzyme, partial [Bacillota bacterium]
RLGRRLGLPNLFLKYEGANPTGSFKDRGTAVALTQAVRTGHTRAGTVSSGNMAASVAAYAARAGLEGHIMVPAHLKPEKVFTIAVYGPKLYRVEGDYGELYRKALALGRERGIFFAVSDDPFRVEGQKTTGYEVVRDLARLGLAPTHVFNPTSAGGHTSGLLKGFEEMADYRAIAAKPAVVAVQAAGCSPIATAFSRGETRVTRVEHPSTEAHAIQNPFPPSGGRVLRALARAGRGAAVAVTDEAMRQAQLALAHEEGLFVQMESAASLAAAEEWRASGRLSSPDVVVLVATGSGLKDPGAFAPSEFRVIDTSLEDLPRALIL